MDLETFMKELEALGTDNMKKRYITNGARDFLAWRQAK